MFKIVDLTKQFKYLQKCYCKNTSLQPISVLYHWIYSINYDEKTEITNIKMKVLQRLQQALQI